jgi:hypothetical protein
MRRIVSPARAVPAALLRDQAAGVLATRRRALVAVVVVEVAEESHHVALDGEEVVARLGGVVVVALPVEVRVGCVSILTHSVSVSTTVLFGDGGTYRMVQLAAGAAVGNVLLALEAAGEGLGGVGTEFLSRVVCCVGELDEDVFAVGVDVVVVDAFLGAFGDQDGAGRAEEGGKEDPGEEHLGRLLELSEDCWTG